MMTDEQVARILELADELAEDKDNMKKFIKGKSYYEANDLIKFMEQEVQTGIDNERYDYYTYYS